MTAGGDELFVTIGGRDVGLQDILRRVDAEMAVSANKAVQLGQSYARLAQAQGAPALGSQVLAGTLQQAAGASERAIIGLETQAARLASGSTYFQQFGSAASSSLLSVVGPAAALTAGIGLLSNVIGTAEAGFALKASLDADTKAIQIQLAGLRDTNVAFQQAAEYAAKYKLTQQQTTEAIGAAIPVIRNSKASMDTILGTFDQLRVRSPEKTFQDAARALGELQAGQYTSLNRIFNVPLADAKKLSDEIKKGGDAVQLVSQYLTSVGAGMDVVTSRASGAAGAVKDLAISSEQLKLALGDDATGPGLLILQTRIRATQGLINLLRGDTAGMTQGLAEAGTTFVASAAAATAYANAIQHGVGPVEAEAAANAAAIAATNALTQAHGSASGGTFELAHATDALTNYMAAEAAAAEADRQAVQAYTDEVNTAAVASANASVASRELAVVQGSLAAAAQTAANVILQGGGNIAATAARLAASSSGVDQLTAAYLRLAAAQATATGVKLQQQTARQLTGADSDEADIRARQRTAVEQDRQQRIRASSDAARAEENYQKTLGNTAPALARARSELAQLTLGSAAYINKQNDIAKLQQEAEKNAKKAKGAGGSVKLSDQQKLENSLLASQEGYQNKSEDAADQYATDVERIYQDFYTKIQAAQKDFDQSRLDGNASFYDQLGSIENQKIAQLASQQYEAASVEAGKIAQEKGADVANKYMDAQEQIISARARRQADIEKAAKDKDKDKAEYLKGVDDLYRKGEDAKLARIKEGEGSLASERDKQLSDSAAKQDAAQDKIGTAAERAADRQITAADRAGKKIDENTLKAGKLAATYNTVAPGPAPGQPGTGATAATTAAPTADPIASAIESLRSAIAAVESAVRDAGRGVEGAVRSTASGKFAG